MGAVRTRQMWGLTVLVCVMCRVVGPIANDEPRKIAACAICHDLWVVVVQRVVA